MKTKTWADPIVDEIHATRERMAREAEYDVHKLARRLQESQKRHGDRITRRTPDVEK